KMIYEIYILVFSTRFYFNDPSFKKYTNIYGNKAEIRKEFAGKIINYYKKANAAYVNLMAGTIKKGDKVLIIGPTTGVVETKVNNIILDDDLPADEVNKGNKFTFPCSELVRANYTVYVLRKVE